MKQKEVYCNIKEGRRNKTVSACHTIAELFARYVVISLFLISGSAWSQTDYFSHYTVNEGLSDNTVYYAMQDSKGFMWFCTETGVNRYDGHSFVNYTLKDGLADNEIFKCYEDSKGRIWFLSYNGRLSFYDKGVIYNETTLSWLRYNSNNRLLVDIKEDRKGTLWFINSATSRDICYLKDQVIFSYRIPDAISTITTELCVLEGKVYMPCAIENKARLEMQLFDVSQQVLIPFPKWVVDNDFMSVLRVRPYKNGCIMQNSTNVFMLKNGVVSTLITSAGAGMEKEHIEATYMEDHTIWMGTQGNGLMKFVCRGPDSTYQLAESFLQGERVITICRDNDGNLWLGTHNNGVFLLKKTYNYVRYISKRSTYGLAYIPGKQLLLAGTDNGMVERLSPTGDITVIKTAQSGDILNRVLIIKTLAKNTVFIGTDKENYEYDISANTMKSVVPELSSIKAADYLEHMDYAWLCSGYNVCIRHKGRYQVLQYLFNKYKYTAIAGIDSQYCYLGSTGGLFMYDKIQNSLKVIIADTILKTYVSDLKLLPNHELWVGTHGNGVFIVKGNRIINHLGEKDGLLSGVCYQFFSPPGNHSVYISTDKGISVVNQNTLQVLRNITVSDGLSSRSVRSVAGFGDTVYAGTFKGVNMFNMNNMMHASDPPKVYFTNVTLPSGIIYFPGKMLHYDYTQGAVTIEFTGICYRPSDEMVYEYRFAYDSVWNRTSDNHIQLLDLEPGVHTVIVRAKNYNSTWSNPEQLTIQVMPLWYQTLWFRALTFLILIAVIILLVAVRIRTIKRREAEKAKINKTIIDLESKALTYQMNPHFIFNSLNTIQQFMINGEEADGLNYLSDFSVLMRQILINSKKTKVPLSEELDFLKRYMQLEQVRYNGRFDYEIKLEDIAQADDIYIPPTLIQPILENAVKYGISAREKGMITLSLKPVKGFLICRVEDNGPGFKEYNESRDPAMAKKDSTALHVIRERLKYITNIDGETGKLTIVNKQTQNPAEHGVIVEIYVPITD